jgi:hypothetical protein
METHLFLCYLQRNSLSIYGSERCLEKTLQKITNYALPSMHFLVLIYTVLRIIKQK